MSQRSKAFGTNPDPVGREETRQVRDMFFETELYPLFKWDSLGVANLSSVKIAPIRFSSGTESIVLPADLIDGTTREYFNFDQISIDDTWTIDLTTTGIDTATFTGGLLDGVAVAANTDYWVFAFIDPSLPPPTNFKGFGVFRRPVVAWTAVASGTKGSTATFTLASGGFAFRVGQRVLCRESATFGAAVDYNQGTVVSRTNTSLVVLLDNSTIGVAYGTIINSATGTIYALDLPAPQMPTTDTRYPGGGIEYDFVYMGSLQTGASNDVWARKRGEEYEFPLSVQTFYTAAGLVADIDLQVQIAQWVPVGRQTAHVQCAFTKNAGVGVTTNMEISTNASRVSRAQTSHNGVIGVIARATDEVPIRIVDCSLRVRTNNVTAVNTASLDANLLGYIETEW